MNRQKGDAIAWVSFKDWFRHMPTSWQRGLRNALAGGAWMGQLDDPDGRAEVAIFFVHPRYVAAIQDAIQAEAERLASS